MKLLPNLLIVALLLSVNSIIAEEDAPLEKRIYTTKPIKNDEAPVIDGKLNDGIWEVVDWTTDFIENQPDENTAPHEQTKFKIVYDKSYLYIGVRALDKAPDSIVNRLSRRDGFEGDWVEFNIDSYNDKRTAFSFTITVAGVKGDEFISNNGNNWDSSWNPIWYAKTNIDEEGWTAELKIPFSQLRFDKSQNQVWGLQSTRRIFRKEERSLWQRKPRETAGWVSEFGELHGLQDLEPQKQLEIQPFTVSQSETYPVDPGNPFRDGSDFKLKAGLDAKIGITNNLTLDLTVNPDFGQVEADPSSIALDGFEIFFREQRPFFVENKNIFDYRFSNSQAGNSFGSDNLFFSRRIGRSPQGYPDTEDGEFVDRPDNTTILGAAKFSGKTKSGWSIGVLESMTASEYAEIDNLGERRKETVEPFTNYFVGRLQKDFNDQNSFIGGIFTATNRNLPENLQGLHKSAYTGGLDFKHQWKERAWYVGGNVVFSHVNGSKEAILNTQESQRHLFQRVGADYLGVDPDRTSLTGTGGNIQIGKIANGHWRFESGFTWRSPELELNDLGFQRQADDLRHYTWIGYRILKPVGIFRNLGINYNHWSAWDFGGNHNYLQWNVNSWANFTNYWFGNLGLNYSPVRYSNFALRGGPRLRTSPYMNYWSNIGTDNRKEVRLSLSSNGGRAVDNSFNFFGIGGGLSYRPLNTLRISLNPSFDINNDQLQFVENVEVGNDVKYINAKINQRTFSTSLRVNYTINPNLTLQYWGQPFISRGRYTDFKSVVSAEAKDFNDRFVAYDDTQLNYNETDGIYEVDENVNGTTDFTFNNPDFSFVQFRSNLVLRWEYIPGSEIYLVWSQGLSGSADPNDSLAGGLRSQILDQKPENIIFIMSDDHAYQAISAYGSPLIQTPNIDRLAKEGMLFTNACVTNSICAPSRATILTGKHNHINGKIDNRFPFDTTQITFPQIFQENGYKTAMFGKLHFGNNPKGVDEFLILPGQGNYINPDFINPKGDTINIQGYVTDVITDLSIDWLKREAKPEKPFMMMYLHKAPHRPWWPRADKFREFSTKQFPEPESLFDDYANRGTAAKTAEMNLLHHMMYSHDSKIRPETLDKMGESVLPEVPEFKNSFYGPYGRSTNAQKALYEPVLDSINNFFMNNWPDMTDEEKMKWKYQRYMQDYLACISSVDDNVGRLLNYLDESGLAENTIVIYTSDQGFFLGEHGWFDKRFIYNESFKTPLMVRWPEIIAPGSTENEMVQNLDFAQTMLEAAHIDPPGDMQGESLIPLFRGHKEEWDRDAVYYHYYEYPAVHMVKRHYGIVTKEFKLAHFYNDVDEWELYDRLKDTLEMNNVYNDPEYAETLKELKKALKELRVKYKDSPELDNKFIQLYEDNK